MSACSTAMTFDTDDRCAHLAVGSRDPSDDQTLFAAFGAWLILTNA
jgi:hypothetical protein